MFRSPVIAIAVGPPPNPSIGSESRLGRLSGSRSIFTFSLARAAPRAGPVARIHPPQATRHSPGCVRTSSPRSRPASACTTQSSGDAGRYRGAGRPFHGRSPVSCMDVWDDGVPFRRPRRAVSPISNLLGCRRAPRPANCELRDGFSGLFLARNKSTAKIKVLKPRS